MTFADLSALGMQALRGSPDTEILDFGVRGNTKSSLVVRM